jgi:hypothetical protein
MSELSSDELFRVNDIGDRFEAAWRRGLEPRIEEFLATHQGRVRQALVKHLIGIELELLRKSGKHPVQNSYERRFPEHVGLIADVFAEEREFDLGKPKSGF